MPFIRFKIDCDGFEKGQIADLEPGVADAYVLHRASAEYCNEEGEPFPLPPDTKTVDAPPRDKSMRSSEVKRK